MDITYVKCDIYSVRFDILFISHFELKDKCEKDFIERLITDTDEKYKLSDFFKFIAYQKYCTDTFIVQLVEEKLSKHLTQGKLRMFIENNNNIDVIKKCLKQ